LSNFFRNLKGGLLFGGCTVNTVVIILPLMVLALFKLIIPIPTFRTLMSRWIMSLGECWIGINSRFFAFANKTRWDVRGVDSLDRNQWYLVVSNHQTWVDIVAVQTLLNRRIPFLKFFIKQELVWFPLLGIAWWAMDMPFMKRYSKSYLAKHPEKKGMDLEITRKACKKFRDTPTSVINFIEGTRFSEEKKIRRASQFEYLLPPRAGGIALALSAMGEMMNVILDVTIIYPNGPPKFWAMFRGEIDHIVIDIRKRPIEPWMTSGDYANDREFRARFHQWLTGIWKEKDQRIESMRAELSSSE
jgi:1-acyl-sn-glycerol-3-phosphate acyltransferase